LLNTLCNLWAKLSALLSIPLQQPAQKIIWFGLSLLILLADQITKYWASSTLSYGESLPFLPYFDFTLLHNYGAAFSFLADQDGWQRVLLGGVALLVSIFLVVWILCVHINKKLEIAGLSLVLGGAVGNLWDRIQLGYVVDFIDWFYLTTTTDTNDCLPFFYSMVATQSCHWPAFNIADSAILLGAALLLVDMVLGRSDNRE
jgi:signal peptidase II